jgi:uncharacterized protein (TIGR03663 family)
MSDVPDDHFGLPDEPTDAELPDAELPAGSAGRGEGAGPTARSFRAMAASISALSVFVHAWRLGDRPLAHDEAIDAWFSWQAHTTGIIRYDPVYHGPLRFYLEGFLLGHGGTSPAWTRVLAAIAGIGMTLVVLASHRIVGRWGALVAALAITISPTVLTVTRTGREDSLVGLVSLGVLLSVAAALQHPRARHVVVAGALLGVSFTLKETTFIFGFAGAVFFAGLAVLSIRAVRIGADDRRQGESIRLVRSVRSLGPEPWMWAVIAFIAVTVTVFTAGFRYGAGFESGLTDGVRYWLSQHSVGRGSQRWFFYGAIYVGYEGLLLGLAAVGVVVSWRRRSLPGAWFATMGVVQFAVYSWAGEKFAWLALHPLLCAVPLAGLGAEALIDRVRVTDRTALRIGLPTAGAVAAVLTLVVALPPAITDGADTSELLVTVQTSDDLHHLAAELRSGRRDGRIGPIFVDQRDSGSWPWAWYLHEMPDVGWGDVDPSVALPEGYDVYIVSASTAPPTVPEGYSMVQFPLRGWWLPDYDHASVGDLLRWFVSRERWSPAGTSDQYLIARDDTGLISSTSSG